MHIWLGNYSRIKATASSGKGCHVRNAIRSKNRSQRIQARWGELGSKLEGANSPGLFELISTLSPNRSPGRSLQINNVECSIQLNCRRTRRVSSTQIEPLGITPRRGDRRRGMSWRGNTGHHRADCTHISSPALALPACVHRDTFTLVSSAPDPSYSLRRPSTAIVPFTIHRHMKIDMRHGPVYAYILL